MHDELVSIIDLARELGKRKQSVFKVVDRLGIEKVKRRDASKRNQLVVFISAADAERVAEELGQSADDSDSAETEFGLPTEMGVFYLLQLEPDLDPQRFKVGFALSMPQRLRALRCSAPFATVVKTWPCKRLWEKTAIDCVTSSAEQLHTEVFRSDSLDDVRALADSFFALMLPTKHGESPDEKG